MNYEYSYRTISLEGEIETTNNIGKKWYLWLDHIEDIVFIADVLNDYIAELNLRKEADNV